MKQKKVVVFGGAGFIGSYIVDELLRRNYKVVIADIREEKYKHDRATFVKCDIRNRDEIAAVITPDIDYVYNFAGFANLEQAIQHPVTAINLNIMGNLYILDELRKKSNIERYIYASSAYALNDKGSFYGISKLASEKLIEEFYKQYGLKYTILRYGSIYSERNFDNNYVYSLIKEIIENHKVVHKGDGNEIREYIHAADVARMAVNIIESEEYVNQFMILTGVERMHRSELFAMIKEVLGEDFEIEYKDKEYENHYKLTPYTFQPTMSRKMISDSYIDMGQGILECIKQIKSEQEDGYEE